MPQRGAGMRSFVRSHSLGAADRRLAFAAYPRCERIGNPFALWTDAPCAWCPRAERVNSRAAIFVLTAVRPRVEGPPPVPQGGRGLETLGRHCIIEYYDCPRDIMDDVERIKKAMCDAAVAMNATIVAVEFHHFNPHGVSGMVVISESHLSIHTWPEFGYAAVDVFTCGDIVDPWFAHERLREAFQAKRESVVELKRGILDAPATTVAPREQLLAAS